MITLSLFFTTFLAVDAVSRDFIKDGFQSLFGDQVNSVIQGVSRFTDMFEGDMRLGNKGLGYYLNSFPVSDQGRLMDENEADINFRWDEGKVPYRISTSDASAQRAIKGAIKKIEMDTCLEFHQKTSSDRDYIDFVRDSGCWSYVGRRGGKQEVSVGIGCESVGIVQHEIMHALGFFHEQSRFDRDNYVTIKYENIESGRESNFKKYDADRTTNLGIPYDYGSVMHYKTTSFSKNGLPTIDARGHYIGQRTGLSPKDTQKINKLYQCSDDPTDNKIVKPAPSITGGGTTTTTGGGLGGWGSRQHRTCIDVMPTLCKGWSMFCFSKDMAKMCKETCAKHIPECSHVAKGTGTNQGGSTGNKSPFGGWATLFGDANEKPSRPTTGTSSSRPNNNANPFSSIFEKGLGGLTESLPIPGIGSGGGGNAPIPGIGSGGGLPIPGIGSGGGIPGIGSGIPNIIPGLGSGSGGSAGGFDFSQLANIFAGRK